MDTANPEDPATRTEVRTPAGRIPADTFSNRLLLARALAGHVSIREAADITGLNREAWRDWERGRRPRDILDVVRRIADALDVDHDWLLFGGPLAGPRGVPTKRVIGEGAKRRGGSNLPYARVTVRPRDTRPSGGPAAARRTPPTTGPGAPRRPVRISSPAAVAAASR